MHNGIDPTIATCILFLDTCPEQSTEYCIRFTAYFIRVWSTTCMDGRTLLSLVSTIQTQTRRALFVNKVNDWFVYSVLVRIQVRGSLLFCHNSLICTE